MELKEYLNQKLNPATAKRYERDIDFLFSLEINAPAANYAQILEVTKQLRDQYENPKTISRILAAIKKYYDYLLYTGQRDDHPCRNLHLKDAKRGDIQLQDLFTEKELEQLLAALPNRFVSYHQDHVRNRLILSFLIYQGLMREEVSNIKIEHLILGKGEIYLPGNHQLNSRTLPLRANQIHLIYQYIDYRKTYQPKRPTSYKPLEVSGEGKLFTGQRGQELTGDAIRHLLKRYKYLFPDRQLSCSTIRMSVCRNLLKSGKDLRAVQVYMGHKYPSSTERYKTSGTEALKQAIKKYHPLS